MGTTEIVNQWAHYLKTVALPNVGQHLVQALALFSLALTQARSCNSGRVSQTISSPAMPASRRRRWERWLANPRFNAHLVQRQIAQAVWRQWHGTRAQLLIDETSRGTHLRCLKACLAYRKRTLPLAEVCYRSNQRGMVRRLTRLMRQALEFAPPAIEIVVIADRGLSWPSLLDACVNAGHHFLLRLQGTTIARLPDGQTVAVKSLAPRRRTRAWLGDAEVFQKSGWRPVSLIALWARGCKEPWLLITDQSACAGRWRMYARRMWIEESIRDDKSQGFGWQSSRVADPAHALRLLVIVSLAALLALSLGTWLIKRGLRHELDPRRRRRLSVFQLGLQALTNILEGWRPKWPLEFYFHAT